MSSQLEKMPKKFHVFIHSVNPSSLFIGGRIGFLKNYRKEGSRFSCKNGGVGGGGVSIEAIEGGLSSAFHF